VLISQCCAVHTAAAAGPIHWYGCYQNTLCLWGRYNRLCHVQMLSSHATVGGILLCCAGSGWRILLGCSACCLAQWVSKQRLLYTCRGRQFQHATGWCACSASSCHGRWCKGTLMFSSADAFDTVVSNNPTMEGSLTWQACQRSDAITMIVLAVHRHPIGEDFCCN
jgi:hypothetical protein